MLCYTGPLKTTTIRKQNHHHLIMATLEEFHITSYCVVITVTVLVLGRSHYITSCVVDYCNCTRGDHVTQLPVWLITITVLGGGHVTSLPVVVDYCSRTGGDHITLLPVWLITVAVLGVIMTSCVVDYCSRTEGFTLLWMWMWMWTEW